MPRGTRIVSEKQHWTQVGYNAALRRLMTYPQDFREVMDKAGLLPTRQYD